MDSMPTAACAKERAGQEQRQACLIGMDTICYSSNSRYSVYSKLAWCWIMGLAIDTVIETYLPHCNRRRA